MLTNQTFVAVAVIAVGVGVQQGADRGHRGVRRHRGQHLVGQMQVEQCVDQQRCPVADHQPGGAPAPTAVRLEIGEAPVAQFMKTPAVRHAEFVPRTSLGG